MSGEIYLHTVCLSSFPSSCPPLPLPSLYLNAHNSHTYDIPLYNVSTVGPQTVYSHPPVATCKQRAALTIALFSASNDLGVWALNLQGALFLCCVFVCVCEFIIAFICFSNQVNPLRLCVSLFLHSTHSLFFSYLLSSFFLPSLSLPFSSFNTLSLA